MLNNYRTKLTQSTLLGGHGFAAGKHASEAQKRMVEKLDKMGILVIRQPSNSPETNLNDLALFNSLKGYMRARSNVMPESTRNNKSYIQSIMWTMLKKGVSEFEPRKLFNASLQRQVLLGMMIQNGGQSVREKHYRIREFWGTGRPKKQYE